MTEHAKTPEELVQQTGPELSLVENRFPDVTFDLSPEKFVEKEGSVLEVNDSTRTIHVFRVLNDAFPDLEYPEGRERERKIRSVQSYLGQTALIANPRKVEDPTNYHEPHEVKVQKRDYTKQALDHVLAALEEENHPTYQILSQVEQQFGEEMGNGSVFSLKREVIFAAHHKMFKNEVADLVNRDRQVD